MPAPVAMTHCHAPRARRQLATRRPLQLAAAATDVRQKIYPPAASARSAKPAGRRSTASGSPYPGAAVRPTASATRIGVTHAASQAARDPARARSSSTAYAAHNATGTTIVNTGRADSPAGRKLPPVQSAPRRVYVNSRASDARTRGDSAAPASQPNRTSTVLRSPAIERRVAQAPTLDCRRAQRSEEHTSELQSHVNLVCRLLLEKKKKNIKSKIKQHNTPSQKNSIRE